MPRPKIVEGEKDARERIIDAFWTYARKIPVRKMSARMLSEAAGCNRSTFYYYFDGISGLYDQALKESGLRDNFAREFSAIVTGKGEGGFTTEEDRAKFDDLCMIAHVNRGGLEKLGAVDHLHSVFGQTMGIDVSTLDPERRAMLEFAIYGLLAVLAYRGSLDNAIPYESLSRIMRDEVVPHLKAIAR